MSIETPRSEADLLQEIKEQFYPAAAEFSVAKARDERDASMNKDFVAMRQAAAERVNEILDKYLDLSALISQSTPLETS